MKAFNVCLLSSPKHEQTRSLFDVVEWVVQAHKTAGFVASATLQRLEPSATNIIVGAHLATADELATIPVGSVVLNTESLTAEDGLLDLLCALAERNTLWDTSTRNCELLAARGVAVRACVPCFVPGLDRLRSRSVEKDIDVVIWGQSAGPRAEVVSGLRAKGLRVECAAGKIGPDWEAILARAHLYLDIPSAGERSSIARQTFLFHNEVAVVGVWGNEVAEPPWSEAIHVVDLAHAVNACVHLLRDRDALARQRQRARECLSSRSSPDLIRDLWRTERGSGQSESPTRSRQPDHPAPRIGSPTSGGDAPEAALAHDPDRRSSRAEAAVVSSETPLVSVIMPTFNRIDLLLRAVRSIKEQTYSNIEIVIVNDAGAEAENVASWLGRDANITYIRHGKNRGQSAARNTGLKVARGDVVVYLDDDDVFLSHHVSVVVDSLVKSGRPFVYTEAEYVSEQMERGQIKEIERRRVQMKPEYSKERLHVCNFIPINTWAHRRGVIDDVGLLDESLKNHEDWDFLLRCSRKFDLLSIPEVTVEVHERARDDNTTRRERSKFHDTFTLLYGRYDDLGNKDVAEGRRQMLDHLRLAV